MSEPTFKVSTPAKKQIARAFGLKAHQYDSNAVIQKELLIRINRRILNNPSQEIWADLGCGTGILEQLLKQTACPARFLGVDIAFESLRILQSRRAQNTFPINADLDLLPFKHSSLCGIVLSSVLQWFADPLPVLENVSNILKNNGLFLFSAFIKGSFFELNLLRKESGLEIPVFLPDEKYLCSFIKRCDFVNLETEIFTSTIYYPTAFDLIKSISAIGGTAVSGNRLPRSRLFQFCNEFENRFRCDKGVPITYRALIGSANKGL